MTAQKIIKNNFKTILKTLVLVLNILIILTQVSTLATTKDQIEANFQKQKTNVQSQIENINKTLDEIAKSQEEVQIKSTTLAGQTKMIKEETKKIDDMIFQTRIVIQQVEKEIVKNEAEIESLNKEIRDILREMQLHRQNNILQIFLTSNNLSQALNEVYNLSSVNERLEEKRQEIETKNRILSTNKKQHQEIKDQLERSRSLLRSKESNLAVLLEQTQGQESKYQQLIASITSQKEELQAQLGGLEGDFLAEIKALQEKGFQEEYDESVNCNFEDQRRLQIPSDYFTKPADGWLTQGFHCGHDGIDIANSIGSNIYAIGDGVVERIGPNNNGCIGLSCNGGFGNYILVRHRLPSDQTVYSLYAHLNKVPTKRVGEQVSKGQVIGEMGCTGYTKPFPCGSHIHFVLLSDTYETAGLGCRLGSATCFNPLKYMKL
jgi:murein DD-endopeptidase MepM/ murein hydrolase activator NlpD